MVEDKEMSESGCEAEGGLNPVAVALALGGASREKADGFLDDQRALIADQRHHLHEQFKHLHLSVWEKQLGVLLRVATAVMGLGIAAGLGFMVWQASTSNGLLIEPFSVPPDLASRGLTGQVIATKLQDRLADMQAQTNSGRPAKSYANSWGEHGIKLEIPEAGISLTELDNFLRAKLGHDIHVSGEIVRKASGLALTARAGDASTPSITGQEEDVDALVQQLAEQVYRLTQPFRYGMFLTGNGRADEALPVFEKLAKTGDKEDRLWAYNRWVGAVSNRDGVDAAIRLYRQGLAIDPDAIGMYDNFGGALGTKGRTEEQLQVYRAQMEHLLDGKQTYVPTSRIPTFRRMARARIDNLVGGYHEAAETWVDVSRTGYPGYNVFNLTSPIIASRIGEHDVARAREAIDVYGEASGRQFDSNLPANRMRLAMLVDDWRGMLALADAAAPELRKRPLLVLTGAITPLTAYANARLGRFTAAQALIAPTPADCYICLRMRAEIAELQGQNARADFWFARALAAAPSLPLAESEWGQALLARGKPDEAIAQFKLANRKGPHFADPLEMWGEALMAKNQSHLALAKFNEAEKYAPNWGRLHLKWGEALVYAGKKDEAKAQFARAATLDLTVSDKAELAGVNHV
jgi:tetratricopeptide (TPR) repeat protein